MRNPFSVNVTQTPQRTSARTLAVVVLLAVAVGGYVFYMKGSVTGIQAKLQYSNVARAAMPDATKTVNIFENEAALLLIEAGNNQYSLGELQELKTKASAGGRQFTVPEGIPVMILDRHLFGDDAKVRILEGENSGQTGYVSTTALHIPFWDDF